MTVKELEAEVNNHTLMYGAPPKSLRMNPHTAYKLLKESGFTAEDVIGAIPNTLLFKNIKVVVREQLADGVVLIPV